MTSRDGAMFFVSGLLECYAAGGIPVVGFGNRVVCVRREALTP